MTDHNSLIIINVIHTIPTMKVMHPLYKEKRKFPCMTLIVYFQWYPVEVFPVISKLT